MRVFSVATAPTTIIAGERGAGDFCHTRAEEERLISETANPSSHHIIYAELGEGGEAERIEKATPLGFFLGWLRMLYKSAFLD